MGRHREFDLDKALDAAMSVFWQRGYEGASYEDLTRATGVARPGLYSAFGNKETLFRLALDRYNMTHLSFTEAALQEPKVRDVVRHLLEGVVTVTTTVPGSPGCLGINGALACSDAGEAIRRELVARRDASEALLLGRLERAQTEGDLPESADCAVLASYVTTISQGIAVQAKAGASREKLQAIVRHALEASFGE